MGAFGTGIGSAIIAAILWFLRKRGEEQQTYLCKKDRNGFAYMRHNILVVAVAILGLAVSIFLMVIGGIYILPNKSMSTLLLPAIPIILGVLIASAATLIAKVTLTDNELIYGVFKRKHILLSDLQKAAITNPPCVYRKNKRAVVYINASQKIEISYDTYYGSQDFIQLLGKALRTNIQYNDVKREVSATTRIIGLSVAAYAIVVLIYMLSLLSNSTFYSSIFDAAAPSAPTRELVIFQGQDITNERLKEMVDNEEIPADVENLNLAYNQISNVTALQSLINLQDLDLYDSEI